MNEPESLLSTCESIGGDELVAYVADAPCLYDPNEDGTQDIVGICTPANSAQLGSWAYYANYDASSAEAHCDDPLDGAFENLELN